MASFILNDQSKTNSHGFRLLNKDLDLARFRENPVMLDDHWSGTASVIGRWENLRFEGSVLLADPVFDTEDPKAAALARKVDKGFIKGCSLGVSYDRGKMQMAGDGVWGVDRL